MLYVVNARKKVFNERLGQEGVGKGQEKPYQNTHWQGAATFGKTKKMDPLCICFVRPFQTPLGILPVLEHF